jgi:hypothetical protein
MASSSNTSNNDFDSVAKWRHRYAVTEAKERIIVAAMAGADGEGDRAIR